MEIRGHIYVRTYLTIHFENPFKSPFKLGTSESLHKTTHGVENPHVYVRGL